MPVKQRSGTWTVSIGVGGRRIRKALGKGATRQDALAYEARLRSEVIAGKLGKAPKKLLSEAVIRWQDTEAIRLKSRRDLDAKVRVMLPHIRGRMLSQVVEAADAVKEAGAKDGLKAATLNRRLAILKRVAGLAYRQWGWLDKDLATGITLIPGETHRHAYLTPAQVDLIASACTNQEAGTLVRLASMSGLRVGELLKLKPESLSDGCLYLSESKNGKPRVIPLPAEALPLAASLPFQLSYWGLQKQFKRATKAAGLPGIRFHDLRHTYASWLVQAGVPLVAVRDLLGHCNLSVTSRYSHLDTGHLRDAVSKLRSTSAPQGQVVKTRRTA